MADDDPLRLMYTSGTESRPKGVMLSSRSLIAQYVSCIVDGGMSRDDVELHTLPMYHCAQLDCFFSVDVYLGATSVILPGPDPAAMLAAIGREQVTKLFCPPTMWISLLRHPCFDDADLSSLRKGYYGASPMPIEILGNCSPGCPTCTVELLRPNRDGTAGDRPRPHDQFEQAGSAGSPAEYRDPLVDDQDHPSRPASSVISCDRSPHPDLAISRTRRARPRPLAEGGFTAATWAS